MLTFTEEITLLMLDDDGRFLPIRGGAVEHILIGAVLMDLAFANRVDTDLESLVVIDATPTGNPLIDRTLERLASSDANLDTKGWVEALAREQAAGIRRQVVDKLVERGIIEVQDERFLWVFQSRRYPTIDGRVERGVKLRMEDVLLSDDMPDPRDIALVCLVDACDILTDIFSEREMERVRPRIEQLRKMDLIGRDVGTVIADIETTITMAMAQAAH